MPPPKKEAALQHAAPIQTFDNGTLTDPAREGKPRREARP